MYISRTVKSIRSLGPSAYRVVLHPEVFMEEFPGCVYYGTWLFAQAGTIYGWRMTTFAGGMVSLYVQDKQVQDEE